MTVHVLNDPNAYLAETACVQDGEINLALAALALSARTHPGRDVRRYIHHLNEIGNAVAERHAASTAGFRARDGVYCRLRSLTGVISGAMGYTGDIMDYDSLDNADLISVIDRRKGLPVALGILYVHAARSQGWQVSGLNFPGHFVLRLEVGGERLVFDPFHDGRVLEAPDLRAMVKKAMGAEAELSAMYYQPASNRDILIRLQNNIKIRKIRHEDYIGALEIVEALLILAPDEYRLMFDAGILYARTGQPAAAIRALESYLEYCPHESDRADARRLMREIRSTLN